MKREPVDPTPRKSFTPAEKESIRAKSDGHCAYPMCEETEGLEFDHVVSIWMGGKHTVENAEAICPQHHKLKTAQDAAARARVKRQQKAEAGEKNPSTIRSRGFPKGKRKLPSRPFPKRKP